MVVRVIEAKEDKVTTADLIAELKKSSKIQFSHLKELYVEKKKT